jgi:hypothetical protein
VKTSIALLTLMLVTATFAEPIPLLLRSTGYTELINPTSLTYVEATSGTPAFEGVPPYIDEDGLEVQMGPPSTPAIAAQPAFVVIHADYRLSSGVPVVDIELSGIQTTISPKSSPVFVLEIRIPESAFMSYYPGDGAALLSALAQAGSIVPNAALSDLVRQVAAQVIASEQ